MHDITCINIFNTIEDITIDEEALVKRINDEVYAQDGVQLEDLINPSKVVNFERDLIQLNNKLEQTKDNIEKQKLEKKINDIQKKLNIEKRAVMRGWLKNLFVIQSLIAGMVSLGMVYDSLPGFPNLPLSIKVLGFWMWWLFIIPSLRARKPSLQEKEALNYAFLLSPLVSVAMPFITKDVVAIWWANAAAVAVCYLYGYAIKEQDLEMKDNTLTDEDDFEGSQGMGTLLKKAFKALDYGSGRERGLRK